MKKTALEIYSLAVCFIAVVALVISLGTGLYSFIEISYPEFTINQWQYEQFQSNDAFWDNSPKHFPPELKGEPAKKPSEEELTKMRNEAYERALSNESRSGAQTLVQSIIFFLISAVVFFLHWRIFKKNNE
jgi:hypothetical protein